MKAGPSTKPKASVAGSSKTRSAAPAAPAPAKVDTSSKVQLEESKGKDKQPAEKPKDKPKATGKIGFFKAKPKEVPKPEVTKPKADVQKKQFFKKELSLPAIPSKEVIAEVKVVIVLNTIMFFWSFYTEGNKAEVNCT